MNNIKEYNVITAASRDDLVRNVNLAITQGWQPAGGVTMANNETGVYLLLAQAIVK